MKYRETEGSNDIPGLADSGGAMQLTVNDAPAFRSAYATMYSAYTSAATANKGFWLESQYPSAYSMSSFFIPVSLAPLGFGASEVDSVLENMLNVIPGGDYIFSTKST